MLIIVILHINNQEANISKVSGEQDETCTFIFYEWAFSLQGYSSEQHSAFNMEWIVQIY